jgi:hypothetical protein
MDTKKLRRGACRRQEDHGAGCMAHAGKLAFLQDRGVLKVTAPTVRQD